MLTPQQQQSPRSPKIEQVSQELSQQLSPLEEFRKLRESIEPKLDQCIAKRPLSKGNNEERLKNISEYTDKIFENAKKKKIELDKQGREEGPILRKDELTQNTLKTEKLSSQNSSSSDSGGTFLRYCVTAGFLALLIGAVTSYAKIMAAINHFINQATNT